LLFVLRILRNT